MNLQSNLQEYLAKSSTSSNNKSKPYLSWFKSSSVDSKQLLNNGDVDDAGDSQDTWFSTVKEDPCLPSMSKKQRLLGFVICLVIGAFCFMMSTLYIPVLVLRARKFVMLFSMGSIFTMMSFSLLWGPYSHAKHLIARDRIVFTSSYLITLFLTLYFALWIRSTILTLVFAVLQILTLLQYIVSYIPGGKTGLKYFSKIFYSAASKTVERTLPI